MPGQSPTPGEVWNAQSHMYQKPAGAGQQAFGGSGVDMGKVGSTIGNFTNKISQSLPFFGGSSQQAAGPVSPQDPYAGQRFSAPAGNSGNPTMQPTGFDQTSPGVGEQFWNNNQNQWNQRPGGSWASSAFAPGSTAANAANGSFNTEKFSVQPTFDKAYDRAETKGIAQANQQSASRGAYGSSAALNGVGNVISDIESQRANRAGDFALQDQANQRSWADQELGWNKFAGDASFNAGQENFQGLGGAQSAANSAQSGFQNRANSAFGNQFNNAGAVSDFFNPQYQGIIGSDEAALDQYHQYLLGQTQQGVANNQYANQQGADVLNRAQDLYKSTQGPKTG